MQVSPILSVIATGHSPPEFPPAMAQRLAGIFTPNIVPLDNRGQINEPELRRYVDWLIERGVHGLYPNGSTGEFTRFTVEERRRIVKIVCDQCGGGGAGVAGGGGADVRAAYFASETDCGNGGRGCAHVPPVQ